MTFGDRGVDTFYENQKATLIDSRDLLKQKGEQARGVLKAVEKDLNEKGLWVYATGGQGALKWELEREFGDFDDVHFHLTYNGSEIDRLLDATAVKALNNLVEVLEGIVSQMMNLRRQ